MALTAKEWRILEEKLAGLEPAVRKAMIEAVQRHGAAVNFSALVELIDAGRISDAVEMLRLPDAWASPISEAVRAAFVTGGQTVGELLTVALRAKFGFGMNPRASAWASAMSSRLIQDVNQNLPEVQGYIAQAVDKGIPAKSVALDIVGRIDRVTQRRTGGLLGLNAQQTRWAASARVELASLDSNYFTRKLRDKRFDSTIARAIREGRPLKQADINRIAARYNDRLLKDRGNTIARTETLNALRAGQNEGFLQLVEAGLADEVEVGWLATADGRTRDSHVALNGSKITLGQSFVSPATGALIDYPGDTSHGAHGEDVIKCRCVALYRIRRRAG